MITHNVYYVKCAADDSAGLARGVQRAAPPLAWNAGMGRKRNRLNWTWDDEEQQFHTPSGQIVTLTSIAQLLADRIDCRHDFAGAWSGWKMRGDALIPPGHGPGAPRLKPNTVRLFLRWIAEATEGGSGQSTRREDHPRLLTGCTSIH